MCLLVSKSMYSFAKPKSVTYGTRKFLKQIQLRLQQRMSDYVDSIAQHRYAGRNNTSKSFTNVRYSKNKNAMSGADTIRPNLHSPSCLILFRRSHDQDPLFALSSCSREKHPREMRDDSYRFYRRLLRNTFMVTEE